MRFWIMAMLAWPAAALLVQPGLANPPGPVEVPPDDFAGAQYIDTAGCVYLRQGSVWAPRLDSDGSVICGYPPSLPGLAGAARGSPDDIPLRLAVTLAEGLQDHDVLADPPGLLAREPVETPSAIGTALPDLEAAVEAVPRMRAAAAQQPGGQTQLCDLLGYDAAGGGRGTGAGGQNTLGICSGGDVSLQPVLAANDAPAVHSGEPAPAAMGTAKPARDVAHESGATPAKTAAAAAGHAARSAARETAARPATPANPADAEAGAPRTAVAKAKAAPTRPVGDAEMIPAGARYVQIGRYAVAAEAEAAIRQLAGLGYAVARGTSADAGAGGRLVMAGPFGDRQSLVAALNHLRRAGYPKAVAR